MTEFTLTDRESQCWQKLRRIMDRDIEDLRDQLEKSKDATRDAEIRGEIKRLRKIILMVQPPIQTFEDQPYSAAPPLY